MKIKNILSISLIFLLITSCQKEIINENPESEEVENSIESDILVSIINLQDVDYLSMETEEQFPCVNYSILYEMEMAENEIQIEFIEIYEPGDCLTQPGPASNMIDLSSLIQDEIYNIKFRLNNQITLVELIMGEEPSLEILNEGNVRLKD